MAFNSVIFLCWALPLVLLAYYGLAPLFTSKIAPTLKKLLLFSASFVFATWIAQEHSLFFSGLILLNWLFALFISKSRSKNRQIQAKISLLIIIICNLTCLVSYKYLDFFASLLSPYLVLKVESFSLIQPLGISFLTFSLISYVVDCYRQHIIADKNLLNFSLWALFFPKLTSGPIARYDDMFSQENLERAGSFDRELVAYGMRRFVIGLAKKVMIADILGVSVDTIFGQQVLGIDTPTAWIGILAYSLQIFFDFSGYSDMALGLAALFGYRLKENFNYPYCAHSLGEFWHRWHISLSTWLRDYVYFPLGGSRRGNVYVNLSLVFLLSGLWHGANLTFVAWGAWYAFFMVLERILKLHAPKVVPWLDAQSSAFAKCIGWLLTIFIVIIGWVFFRSENLYQAWEYVQLLFGIGQYDGQFFKAGYYLDGRVLALFVVGSLLSFPLVPKLSKKLETYSWYELLRSLACIALFVLCLAYVLSSSYSPFLYAQF